jgi:hypothetical protein
MALSPHQSVQKLGAALDWRRVEDPHNWLIENEDHQPELKDSAGK